VQRGSVTFANGGDGAVPRPGAIHMAAGGDLDWGAHVLVELPPWTTRSVHTAGGSTEAKALVGSATRLNASRRSSVPAWGGLTPAGEETTVVEGGAAVTAGRAAAVGAVGHGEVGLTRGPVVTAGRHRALRGGHVSVSRRARRPRGRRGPCGEVAKRGGRRVALCLFFVSVM